MKYIYTLFLLSLTFVSVAQSPFLVNYQGMARDASGNPITNQAITLRFEILQGSVSGAVIYTDNQSGVTTNSLGLFSTQIGKNGTLGQVNWQGSPYFLRVSMDAAGGNNLVELGTQQIVSVPFAMHAETVPSAYANNVLTIGSNTHAISSGTAVTLTQGTGTNISVSAGPDYTISYTPPSLVLSPNNASVGIAGGNFVPLPAQVTPSITPSGIASVTSAASAFTVDVPAPSYNANTGVLSFGSNNAVVTPTLGLSGGVLYSGPFSNSVSIPNAVTVSGTGIANVTGGPNYLVNVPPPTLAISPNNASISIVGSNSVALPSPVTVAGAGNIVNVSGGPTNYTVGVPNPVWTGTALNIGASTTTIAPTLLFSNGILTSGVSSNSVSLANFGPFTQAGTSVTLTTASNNVAIGLNSASARLDVFGNGTSGSIIRANNANATNASPALDVSSSGNSALNVNNTNTGGVAANINAIGGYAINAQNNSATFPSLYAVNTNPAVSGTAGYFKGGLVAESKAGGDALVAKNSVAADVFVVKGTGNVGIGTSAPTATLDIAGTLKIADGTQANGKILVSDAAGTASWTSSPAAISFGSLNGSSVLVGNSPTILGTSSMVFTKQYSSTEVEINLYSNASSGTFLGGASSIYFEIYVDGNPGSVSTRHYFFGSGQSTYISLKSYFAALAQGTHTITIVAATNAGTSSSVLLDSGGFDGKVIVKERF